MLNSNICNKILKNRLKDSYKFELNKCMINNCNHILDYKYCEICKKCTQQFCSDCILTQLQKQADNKCPKCQNEYKRRDVQFTKIEELKMLEILCKYENCGKYLKMEDLALHESTCSANFKQCSYCTNIFKYEDFNDHLKSCDEMTSNCSNCPYESKQKFFKHDCNSMRFIKLYIDKNVQLKIEEILKTLVENKLSERIKNSNRENSIKRLKRKRVSNTSPSLNSFESNMSIEIESNNIEEENNEPTNIFENLQPFLDYKKNNSLVPSIRKKLLRNLGQVTAISDFHTLDSSIIFGFIDGSIKIFEGSNVYQYYLEDKHSKKVSYILDLKEKSLFISSGSDKLLKLWKLENRKSLITIQQDYESIKLETTKDFGIIASAEKDQKIRFWNVITSELIKTISFNSMNCFEIINSELNCNYLIKSGKDSTLCLWDITTCLELDSRVVKNNIKIILKLDDNQFFTSDSKGYIDLWQIESNRVFWLKEKINTAMTLEDCEIMFLFLLDKNNLAIISTENKFIRYDIRKKAFYEPIKLLRSMTHNDRNYQAVMRKHGDKNVLYLCLYKSNYCHIFDIIIDN